MELVSPLLINLLAVVAILSGLALAAWWVVGLYWMHSRRQEEDLPKVELPDRLHEVFAGTPPVLVIFYIFTAISMGVYVLYIWLGGISY